MTKSQMDAAMLRQATRTNIPQIFRVRYAVRENKLAEGYVISAEDVRQVIEETGRGWIIEIGEEIVAFAIGNAETGNIWALFVHSDAGTWVWQRLHAEMVAWLWSKKLQRLWLTTDPQTRAYQFYQRLEWLATGVNVDGEVSFELSRQSAQHLKTLT